MSRALHRRAFWTSAGAAFAMIALALGYLGTRSQPSAQSSAVEKLSIAVPMVPHSALLYIAAAKGFFAAEGLDAVMIPTIHGKAAVELVVEGKADLGAASDVVFVLSAARGGGLGIAANMLTASSDLAVVARRDRGIYTPRDLVGKKVGVTVGAAGEYFLWAFLIRHKLASDSVTLVDMPPGQTASAIAAGHIDAMSSWQPNVLDVQRSLGENAVTFYEPLAYLETFNVVGRLDFLKAHSEAMKRLVRAIIRAEQFNGAHPDEALKIVAEWLKIDAKVLSPFWKDLVFKVDLRQSQLTSMEDEARWAMARGYIDAGPIPNFLPKLYLDALMAVQPERVTVIH